MDSYVFIYMEVQEYLRKRTEKIPTQEEHIHDLVHEIEDHMFIHNEELFMSYGQDDTTRRFVEILTAIISVMAQDHKTTRPQDKSTKE